MPNLARLKTLLANAWQILRRVTGDDAYERYVAHCASHHPDSTPLTRAQFVKMDQARRWDGVRRCC